MELPLIHYVLMDDFLFNLFYQILVLMIPSEIIEGIQTEVLLYFLSDLLLMLQKVVRQSFIIWLQLMHDLVELSINGILVSNEGSQDPGLFTDTVHDKTIA